MDNLELVRWEVKDRAAALQRMAGQRSYAQQIDQQVKERQAAHQRMAEEARLAAGSDASKPSGQHVRAFVSLLIGIVGVLAWLVAR
jgi:hypothetical protein